ncbi:MAG: hypothetical protein A2173_09210 [Planctomycetes bacterium RBG_13_44_8b]|nr:MAG: hypothetical protein A2173_09210 [Planctomycetes bacterium RBG_13_44_8b]
MELDIDELKKSIDHFIEETDLRNIKSILQDDTEMVLGNLLGGYSAALSAGIALYYSTEDPENTNCNTLEQIESDTIPAQRMRFSHPVCIIYRSHECQDKKCREFDKKIAMKYYNKDWWKPTLYRCHLNVWDMAYPLIVDEIPLAVLLTGQIVVKKGSINWPVILKEIKDNSEYQIYWDPFDPNKKIPERSNQFDDIKSVISKEADKEYKDELMYLAETCPDEKSSNPEEVVIRFKYFIKFRDMLGHLLQELYAAKKEAAMRQLMQAIAHYLAGANLSSRKSWAKHCEELFSRFCTISNIQEIHVYSRSRSNYERTIPFEEKRSIIKVKDILPFVSLEKLVNLNNEDSKSKALMPRLGLGTEDIWLFRTENRAAPSTLAGLIVMKGKIKDKNQKLVEFFCRTVGGCNDVASLIFELQEQQNEFRLKVGEAAHSFRTPLQSLILDIEKIGRIIKDDKDLTNLLNESKRRILGAREDVKNLLEQLKEHRTIYNISLLAEEVMNTVKPVADAHPCLLVKCGNWPVVNVRINKDRIRHALTGLIDNAIKYSWGGKKEEGAKKLHEVRVWVDVSNYDMAMVRIINYGIGIPPDLLEAKLELGMRGMVYDSKRDRPGTGFGLPIAEHIFREHGGHLEIDSYPADNDPRGPDEEYHRYVTEVKAYLPIYR